MICIRSRYGKEVRVAAPAGETSGTLTWLGGALEVPIIEGELVISRALAEKIPRPTKHLEQIQCVLTSGSEQCIIIYIYKPQEALKRWQSI